MNVEKKEGTFKYLSENKGGTFKSFSCIQQGYVIFLFLNEGEYLNQVDIMYFLVNGKKIGKKGHSPHKLMNEN